MMLEFDTSTLANLTAALDHGCKSLPPDLDTSENRKRLGDALLAAARSYRRSLPQLSEVAEDVVAEIVRSSSRSPGGVILQKLKQLF
jgi:hypothetical protein